MSELVRFLFVAAVYATMVGLGLYGFHKVWTYSFGQSQRKRCTRCRGKRVLQTYAAGSTMDNKTIVLVDCDECGGRGSVRVHVPGKFK